MSPAPCDTWGVERRAISASVVRRLIAAQFPKWSDLDVVPVDVDGWDNVTFRLGEDMSDGCRAVRGTHRRSPSRISGFPGWHCACRCQSRSRSLSDVPTRRFRSHGRCVAGCRECRQPSIASATSIGWPLTSPYFSHRCSALTHQAVRRPDRATAFAVARWQLMTTRRPRSSRHVAGEIDADRARATWRAALGDVVGSAGGLGSWRHHRIKPARRR